MNDLGVPPFQETSVYLHQTVLAPSLVNVGKRASPVAGWAFHHTSARMKNIAEMTPKQQTSTHGTPGLARWFVDQKKTAHFLVIFIVIDGPQFDDVM